MYHNIEKSAFRPGEYVGYADGVWRIIGYRQGRKFWQAIKRDGSNTLFGDTLKEISRKLSEEEKENGK